MQTSWKSFCRSYQYANRWLLWAASVRSRGQVSRTYSYQSRFHDMAGCPFFLLLPLPMRLTVNLSFVLWQYVPKATVARKLDLCFFIDLRRFSGGPTGILGVSILSLWKIIYAFLLSLGTQCNAKISIQNCSERKRSLQTNIGPIYFRCLFELKFRG